MNNTVATLSYAIRPIVVIKYIGQLLVIVAILTLAPLIVALAYAEFEIAFRYFTVIIVTLLLALPTLKLQATEHLMTSEALVITALAFSISPLLMSYPMSAAGLPWLDALFEAISGVTTTGLTTVVDLEHKPRTFLFARAWMQWYGGLGIVVLSVALLMRHQLAARRLTGSLGNESIVTTSRIHSRRMLLVYVLLTLIGFVILWSLCGDSFVALIHTLSAVSTGGFSQYDNSLAGFENPAVTYAIIGLAVLGAFPLPLYYKTVRNNWRAIFTDVEVRTLLALGLIGTLMLTCFISQNSSFGLLDAAGQSVRIGFSAQTGAGFSSLEIAGLDDASKITLMISMFIGGGIGSTTGGIKILRLLIFFRLIQVIIQRTAMPAHAIHEPSIGGRPLEFEEIQRALLLILLFFAVVLISWLLFVAHGYPALDALFEVVSATGTVGLSTGITHTDLEPFLKGVLCMDMLLGRLEIIALLVILYPRTWFGKRMES